MPRLSIFALATALTFACAGVAAAAAPPATPAYSKPKLPEPTPPAATQVRPTNAAQAEALDLCNQAENILKGEVSEHVRAWGKALAAVEKAFPNPSVILGETMTVYGRALAISGEVDKAIDYQTRGLAIIDRSPDRAKARYAMLLGFAGDSYRMKGQNEESERYFRRSLAELERAGRAETSEGAGAYAALADLAMRRGRADEALDLQRRNLDIRMRILPPGDADRPLALMGLGNHLAAAGRAREAEPAIRAGVEEALRYLPADHPATLRVTEALANFLREAGRSEEGLALVERTIAFRRAGKGSREHLSMALNIMGHLRLDRGDAAGAEAAYLEAAGVVAETAGPTSIYYATYLHNAANAAAARGDDVLAIQRDRQALAILTGPLKSQSPNQIAAVRTSLSAGLFNTGAVGEAATEARAASAFAQETLSQGDLTRIAALTQLARSEAAAGDRPGGLARAKAEIAPIMERMTIRRALSGGLRTSLVTLDSSLGQILETAYLAGDFETGFQTAQLLLETDLTRAAEALNARFAQGGELGGGALADLLRSRQELAKEREGVDRAYITALAAKGPTAPGLRTQLAGLDEQLSGLDRRLDREHPNYRALTEPQPVGVAAAQARLEKDEALVLVIQTERARFTLAVRRDGTAWDMAPVSRLKTREAVALLRTGLGGSLGRGAVDAPGEAAGPAHASFDTATAFSLYRSIFSPAIEAATRDAGLYSIAANDAFTSLPFSVLVTEDPAAARPRAETAWLIRKAALRIAPSIQGVAYPARARSGRNLRRHRRAPSVGNRRPAAGGRLLPGRRGGPRRRQGAAAPAPRRAGASGHRPGPRRPAHPPDAGRPGDGDGDQGRRPGRHPRRRLRHPRPGRRRPRRPGRTGPGADPARDGERDRRRPAHRFGGGPAQARRGLGDPVGLQHGGRRGPGCAGLYRSGAGLHLRRRPHGDGLALAGPRRYRRAPDGGSGQRLDPRPIAGAGAAQGDAGPDGRPGHPRRRRPRGLGAVHGHRRLRLRPEETWRNWPASGGR